ncbi:MAG: hypothetical protein P9M14_07130 [Candidatus Alcyoniella australis]|nr:hypothetical protein [Candidatus Alcyoniella australis]
MTDDAVVKVVTLSCPDCGAALDGLGTDVLFGCSTCGRALDPLRPDQPATPIVYARAQEPVPRLPIVRLPFWVIDVEARAVDSNGNPVVLDGWLEQIWVSAFWTRATMRYGDPAQLLTQRQAFLEPGGERGRLAGIARRPEHASAIARYFQLAQLDKHQDLGENVVDPLLSAAQLVAVPFALEGGSMTDLLLGNTVSTRIVQDLSQLQSPVDSPA